MAVTTRFGITKLEEANSQKVVLINAALDTLDADSARLASANLFTGGQQIAQISDSGTGSTATPLLVRHIITSGAGANNIACGIHLEVESATDGQNINGCRINMIAADATQATPTTNLDIQLRDAGTLRTALRSRARTPASSGSATSARRRGSISRPAREPRTPRP